MTEDEIRARHPAVETYYRLFLAATVVFMLVTCTWLTGTGTLRSSAVSGLWATLRAQVSYCNNDFLSGFFSGQMLLSNVGCSQIVQH